MVKHPPRLALLLGLLACLLMLSACGGDFWSAVNPGHWFGTPGHDAPYPGKLKPDITADGQFQSALRFIVVPIAGLCILAGIGGLVASLFFKPIRTAAGATVACGFGLLVAYLIVLKFASAFAWIVGIGGVLALLACGIPFAIHAFKWSQRTAGVDFGFDGPDSPDGSAAGGAASVPVVDSGLHSQSGAGSSPAAPVAHGTQATNVVRFPPMMVIPSDTRHPKFDAS